MSLKYNEALKILSDGLSKPSKPEHKSYTQDAVEISEKINQELIKMNSIFKGSVTNWEDTCTYLLKDIYKIWIPFLCINMPFKIEPQLVQINPFRGFELKTSTYHPAVENGYVNGLKLTKLFYWDMKRAVERLGKVNCKSGKIYNSLHTEIIEFDGKQNLRIVVKEHEAQEAPSILYQFNIIFTFSQESPGYIFYFNFFLKIVKSSMDTMATEMSEVVNKMNLLLLQLHLDSSLTVEKMHDIVAHTNIHLNKDKLEEILLETMHKIIPFLKNPEPLKCAYGKLWQFKQADSVRVSELKEVFGMQ